MRTQNKLIIAFILIGLLLSHISIVNAFPPLPSSFWGTVKVNGVNVPPDTVISAWINGVKYAYTTVLEYSGDTVYSLDIPGDDLATTAVIEGGVPGDTIVYQIGDLVADQTGSWSSGQNVMKNLTGTLIPPQFLVFLPLILK